MEHDILEERVLEQLSYHIPRYEMGKYNDITPEERELLESTGICMSCRSIIYENKKCKKQNFEWKYENSLQIII